MNGSMPHTVSIPLRTLQNSSRGTITGIIYNNFSMRPLSMEDSCAGTQGLFAVRITHH